MNNPFQTQDRWAGATKKARRILGNMDLESPVIKRLMEICKRAKLKAVTPVYVNDAVSHIGIPSLKIVLFVRSIGDNARIDKARDDWGKEGWKTIAVVTKQIESLPDEQLALHLAAAVKELGK